MPQPQTFLRFTTRGLLYVMLGLSVGLAIAFSLLPPLLGITRGQMTAMLGWYFLSVAAIAIPVVLWRLRAERRRGERLLMLPLVNSTDRWTTGLWGVYLAISLLRVHSGFNDLADGDQSEAAFHFLIAGFWGGFAWFWFYWGHSKYALEVGQRGILLGVGRFFPWDMVRTRALDWPDSREPAIEFYCGSTTYRPVMTPADLGAVEAILTKYKPNYAEVGHG